MNSFFESSSLGELHQLQEIVGRMLENRIQLAQLHCIAEQKAASDPSFDISFLARDNVYLQRSLAELELLHGTLESSIESLLENASVSSCSSSTSLSLLDEDSINEMSEEQALQLLNVYTRLFKEYINDVLEGREVRYGPPRLEDNWIFAVSSNKENTFTQANFNAHDNTITPVRDTPSPSASDNSTTLTHLPISERRFRALLGHAIEEIEEYWRSQAAEVSM